MSGPYSYGGPSDSYVLMNQMPPSTAPSRGVNGNAGGGRAAASKNKVNGGGVGGRHSLGSNSSTPTPQQPHQQYPSITPNNHYHQHPTPQDMVVENTPNSIMTNSNNNPPHYTQQQHIPPHVHQNPPPTKTRNTKLRSSNIQEIITTECDPDDNARNNVNNPPPASGPSLAGPASRNRSLLNGYDPVRPNRASTSPSISFLTDPQPTPSQPQPAHVPVFRKPAEKLVAPPIIKPDIDSPPIAATIKVATPNVAPVAPPAIEQSEKPAKPEKPAKETAKDSTGQRSPKAAKTKKSATAVSASMPKSSGNGLLSGLPGVDILGDSVDQIEIPTIYIHVPLNGETNKHVNFAKLAEEKYGPFALNPRAHREQMRLADLTGDEMMVDESGSESAMEERRMSGVDGGESVADNKPKKRAKRKAHDSYDAHDPFIDDSEMLFEEQAAATEDGFFVFSGPLIRQDERVHVERADGISNKRGRGGGRGRGGARGGGATKPPTQRKPRVKKKSKEQEKEAAAERERSAATTAAAGH